MVVRGFILAVAMLAAGGSAEDDIVGSRPGFEGMGAAIHRRSHDQDGRQKQNRLMRNFPKHYAPMEKPAPAASR